MDRIKGFFNELLLYSGQYALFYIIMNFSKDGINFFDDKGHTLLLLVLFLQTLFLVVFGNNAFLRFAGSLIAPLFYTIIEYRIDYQFVFNTAHLFFWFFSILIGAVQSFQIITVKLSIKKINEYAVTFMNVMIFLFIYFYFDISIKMREKVLNNEINMNDYADKLSVFHLFENVSVFLRDPTHIFIIIGGILLSLSIAVGRVKILELNYEIKRLFGRYVDNTLRDQIISDGIGKPEKVDVCILFSDIRNFTEISEVYKPEEITEMLNIYFTEWDTLSIEYNGIIDKYIGDAVMIVFGRTGNTKAAQNATECALRMLEKSENIKQELAKKKLPVFEDIGIGIHFGNVIAGDIGSKNRVNYTYIGDSVNTASRLEGICKEINSSLVISQTVYDNVGGEIKNQFKGNEKEIYLKGKKLPIKIFYKTKGGRL